MCGIFGSPNITPSMREMLPFLGIAMETRGKDAWGCSNGLDIIKRDGSIIDSWREVLPRIAEWDRGIFHTRGASQGMGKGADNAHPFSYNDGAGNMVIGIHNGFVSNHRDLDTKYSRSCTVDSQHLWMHRAEGRLWEDIHGSGALAWWETRPNERQTLNLCRFNTTALNLALLEGGEYVFCSEKRPIEIASKVFGNPVKTWYEVDEYHHYWFEYLVDGGVKLWRSGEKLKFDDWTRPNHQRGYHGGASGIHVVGAPTAKDLEGWCLRCGLTTVKSEEAVICDLCLNQMVREFNYGEIAKEEIYGCFLG